MQKKIAMGFIQNKKIKPQNAPVEKTNNYKNFFSSFFYNGKLYLGMSTGRAFPSPEDHTVDLEGRLGLHIRVAQWVMGGSEPTDHSKKIKRLITVS